MRKPAFCICENKDADQLRGNREADQRLCFRHIASTIPLLPKSSSHLCDCTARFLLDLVGNPEDRFSHKEVHIAEDKMTRNGLLQCTLKLVPQEVSHILNQPLLDFLIRAVA